MKQSQLSQPSMSQIPDAKAQNSHERSSSPQPNSDNPKSEQGTSNTMEGDYEHQESATHEAEEKELESPKQVQHDEHFQKDVDIEMDTDDADPDEDLEAFDWRGLEEQYHDSIREAKADEEKIYSDFSDMLQV